MGKKKREKALMREIEAVMTANAKAVRLLQDDVKKLADEMRHLTLCVADIGKVAEKLAAEVTDEKWLLTDARRIHTQITARVQRSRQLLDLKCDTDDDTTKGH